MRKIIPLTISLLSLYISVVAQQKSDLKAHDLLGHVRTVKEVVAQRFDILFRIEKKVRITQMAFDIQGRLIEISVYKPDGSLMVRWNYTFDGSGNKNEAAKFRGVNFLAEKITYKYNEQNKLIGELYSASEGSRDWKVVYSYSPSGDEIKKQVYETGGVVVTEEVEKYNQKGALVETACLKVNYGNHSCSAVRRTFKYSARDLLEEQTTYDFGGKVTGRLLWKRADNGNIIEQIHQNVWAGYTTRTVSTFDPLGRKEDTIYNLLDSISGRLSYDVQGRIVKESIEKIDGLHKSSYKREFDSKGNWVKETCSKATLRYPESSESSDEWLKQDNRLQPAVTTYREIVYY